MLTALPKTNPYKRTKENKEFAAFLKDHLDCLKHKEKGSLFLQNKEVYLQKYTHQIHLPPIYHTETLVTKKPPQKQTFLFQHQLTERVKTNPKQKNRGRKQPLGPAQKENIKVIADCPRQQSQSIGEHCKVYHNFVNKKRDKKMVRMREIIEKVVSENIEPWNLEHSNIGHKLKPYQKLSAIDQKAAHIADYLFQRDILGNHSSRLNCY